MRFLPCDFCRALTPYGGCAASVRLVCRRQGAGPPGAAVYGSCDPAGRGAASFVRRADSDSRVQFYSFKDTEKPCFSVFYAYI
ncbi:hypothetical protein EAI98_02415 [Alistipes finegoldii]|nr:hypothetical protein EAI98_02415 [Alistipes finegoldii]